MPHRSSNVQQMTNNSTVLKTVCHDGNMIGLSIPVVIVDKVIIFTAIHPYIFLSILVGRYGSTDKYLMNK